MPMFYWVIEATLTNSWLVFKIENPKAAVRKNVR